MAKWPKFRADVFEFLCRYEWRYGENPTCLDDDAHPITVEQASPDWMFFFTRRHPLPLKFVLPDKHIGDGFTGDKTVLCIEPIRGVTICHEWWLGESVLVPPGSPFGRSVRELGERLLGGGKPKKRSSFFGLLPSRV